MNRHVLALGAIAAIGLLTSIPSLPASAEIVLASAEPATPLQSFAAPNIVSLPVVRDAFGITSYSIVQWPIPAGTTISSGFGYRSCAGCTPYHTGNDFTPGNGYPVQAIADGVVTEGGYAADYGVYVVVQHVVNGQTVSSLYAHMQEGSMPFSVGDTITRGQQVGLVGNTGMSTGPHVHIGISINDEWVDSYAWLLANANA